LSDQVYCFFSLFISRSLSWRVHPPTAYCFGKHLLFFLPCHTLPAEDRHSVLELARFLTELSVIDYFFVSHKPSTVALAALLNAIDDVPSARLVKSDFLTGVQQTCDPDCLDPSSDDVLYCYNRLRLLYVQGGYASNGRSAGDYTAAAAAADPRSDNNSPVSVAAFHGSLPPHHHQSYLSYSETATATTSCAPSSNNPPT
jgi:Cyclin, C-terminal domain